MNSIRRSRIPQLLCLAVFAALAWTACDDGAGPEAAAGGLGGFVRDPLRDRPVAGATVTLESLGSTSSKRARIAQTDGAGEYRFLDLAPGSYLLVVDPQSVVVNPLDANLVHVPHASRVRVAPGVELRVDVDSPVIDARESVQVVSGEETILQPESAPGLRVVVPADAVHFPPGLPKEFLHVVELDYQAGPERTPAAVVPQVMVRIFPDGVEFDPPARITYPDRDSSPEGQQYRYFHHDAELQAWVEDGDATSDGASIDPGAGTTARGSGVHFVSCRPQRVTGVVFDGEATALSGAVVTLDAWVRVGSREVQAYPLDAGMTATTDESGRFEFAAVSASELSPRVNFVSTTAVGRLQDAEPRAADGSGVIDFGDVTLELQTETYFVVEGIVRRLHDFPAHNVSVGWEESPIVKRRQGQTTTGPDGRYEMEVVATPGSEIWIWAYDESDFLGGVTPVTVPELAASGSHVEVDVDLCLESWGSSPTPCGYTGSWSLVGDRLERVLQYLSCDGEETLELPAWELVDLAEGVLSVNVLEAEPFAASYERVGGAGPSGITPANLAGIYASTDHREVLALYPDGRLHQLRNFFPGRGSTRYGSYTEDGESLMLHYQFNDGAEGPGAGESQPVLWARQGDTLVLTTTDGSQDYVACGRAADFSGMERLWLDAEEGTFGLLFYAGEFAGVGD